MRSAGRELLSLALMDARNHTLQLMGQYQNALEAVSFAVPRLASLNPPLWELGHVGWFQERWIGRNLQRALGTRCDPAHARLASMEPNADRWWDSDHVPHDSRWTLDLPALENCRSYLLDTLESTLELLEKADESDDALYFYRLCLFHEDMHGEALAYGAQTLGLTLAPHFLTAFTPPPVAVREPLLLPATLWQLGSEAGPGSGFVFDNEKAPHPVQVPEFDIDAQPVTWAQYVEFVGDGGYDREALWQPAGWQWLQGLVAAEGRRGPRYVEQIGVASGAVMQTRFGRTMRMQGHQPVMHVSWWEADAWCRWAGRRLPSEVEWEVAACTAARRGFRWGDVWEWTGSSFRPYPGFAPDPYETYSQPWFGSHKVLRGASFATRARLKQPKFRNFYLPERDDIFCGFRSCSL
ncbi:ergothioneine biosynthesis protein EgtB [Polaromonas sp. OV174]|uniref:selenoneine synthase SenA n=1 Tax=Polaromonas sp. OV174 TaxID=1855300 RepID=UPI0008E67E39|nr:selenoneine synthase SenA [Polaromonas sp. OV174]SFB75497.1 ergothioneine biosynthesis protein EgtB [Polaromonas sp. OV174]